MKLFKKTAVLCAALAISAVASAAPTPDRQIEILTNSAMVYDGWFVLPERDKNSDLWTYAITDLDRNGRLEVLKVRRGWAEGGPLLAVKELGEDGRSLIGEVALDGTSVPDILARTENYGQPTSVLYDANNKIYHYIFEATVYHGEYESLTTKYALTFSDGTLLVSPLAHCQWNLSGYDGSSTKRYFMPFRGRDAGKEISAARYETIQKEEFPDCEYRGVTFLWRSAEDLKTAASNGELKKSLAESYASFADEAKG